MYDPTQKNADGRFIATYAGQNASTEDFQKIVEKHTGEPMDWFFHQWVYGTSIPSYEFSYQLGDAGSGQTEIAMTITQSDVPNSFKMKLPVYVVVQGQMHFLGTVSVEGTNPTKTSVKIRLRPDGVVLDPGHSILATSIKQ